MKFNVTGSISSVPDYVYQDFCIFDTKCERCSVKNVTRVRNVKSYNLGGYENKNGACNKSLSIFVYQKFLS